MKKRLLVIAAWALPLCGLWLFFSHLSYAQPHPEPPPMPNTPPPAAKTTPEATAPAAKTLKATLQAALDEARGQVTLVVCESDPAKLLVLSESGEWLADMRSLELSVEIGTSAAVRCESYAGPFRPSQLRRHAWSVSSIKTVSAEAFQATVDKLQSGARVNDLLRKDVH